MSGSLPLRAAWRELLAMRWRVFAVMAILGAGFGMHAGIYSAIDSLFGFRDSLYQRADVAGYEIRYSPEDVANVPDWSGIDGVRHAESRLLLPGNIELADGTRLSALLVGIPEDSRINKLLQEQGAGLDPAQATRVVIDRNLARHHGYRLGDPLSVNVGKDRMALDVGGIASSAEFLVDGANPNFFVPARGSLGIVYVPLKLIDEQMGFRLVNSTVFLGEETAHDLPAQAMAEIGRRAGRRLTLEDRLPLTRQFGHMFLAVDLNAFRIFTPAIVAIFAASAITILFFLLQQWVVQQRQQLGVLAAVGYRKGAVVRRVAIPLGLMAVGGLVLGVGIALVMLYGFGHEYANAIGLPSPALALHAPHLRIAAAGVVLACIAGAVWPLWQVTQVSPLAAVRDQAELPPAGRGGFAQRIDDVAWRYPLRDILRHPGTSGLTVVAVALALAPALAYLVAIRSFEVAVVESFSRDKWDYSVDFLSPVWNDELDGIRGLPGVGRVDAFVRGPVRFEVDGVSERALLIGIDPEAAMRIPPVSEGRFLQRDDDDVLVMERKLARDLGLAIGDPVTVDGRRGRYSAMLVGTFSGALPGETFTSRQSARRWLDLDAQNTGVLVSADDSAGLAAALYKDQRVGKVTGRQAMVDEVVAHLKEIAGIVYLAAAFSIMVAILFLFTTTAFAFMAREPGFSLLEVLGFERGLVAEMIRREVWILGLAGIAIALPLGYLLAAWLNAILGDAWFHISTTWHVLDPLLVLIPAMALLPMVARPVVKRISAMQLTDVLRRRSFG